MLLVVYCLLFMCFLLVEVRCSSFVDFSMVFVLCCVSFVVCCLLFVVRCPLFVVFRLLFIIAFVVAPCLLFVYVVC